MTDIEKLLPYSRVMLWCLVHVEWHFLVAVVCYNFLLH